MRPNTSFNQQLNHRGYLVSVQMKEKLNYTGDASVKTSADKNYYDVYCNRIENYIHLTFHTPLTR